jgi:outer membrane protein OmpA-like peptidoglycan-associated protein
VVVYEEAPVDTIIYRYPVFHFEQQDPLSEREKVMLSIREQEMSLLSEPVDDYGDIAESSLTPAMQKALDAKIAILENEPGIRLVVYGHTCNIKSEAICCEIGQQRANEVKYYLVRRGSAPERITAVSMGSGNPVATNDTETGRRKNRRVTFMPVYADPSQ